jgi:precorrin-2/cobalt-factor-2 C20-methyltransferase
MMPERGKLFVIGVGPGDPELMTVKAVKILRNIDVIACPSKSNVSDTVRRAGDDNDALYPSEVKAPGIAYNIAAEAEPEILTKPVLLLEFPMSRTDVTDAHKRAVRKLTEVLNEGKSIAFVTLGDPALYSTFYYISDRIREGGYEVEVISGVTSVTAVAAKLALPLSFGDESVMITSKQYVDNVDTLVIMKAGSILKELKEIVGSTDKEIYLVENCGMPDERIYKGIASIPDEAGYFSIAIVIGRNEKPLQVYEAVFPCGANPDGG